MSAVLALVHRSRIKPSHRRRRKAASTHLVYILNNPLAGKDPTGYASLWADRGSICARDPGSCKNGAVTSSGGLSSFQKPGPLTQQSSGNGAVATGGFKGPGAQRSQNVDASKTGSPAANTASSSDSMPTLENVSVNASVRTEQSTIKGDWSTSTNGRVLSAEWAQYYDEEEGRIANGTFKALAWEAYGKPILFTAGGMYFGAVAADIMYLNEGVALGAAAVGDVGTGVRGGIGPVLRGQAGVEQSITAAQARGEVVLGREITLDTVAGRTRPDLLTRTASGNLKFIESKCGSGACLTSNQRAGFPLIQTQGATPRGANAAAAGLPPGQAIGPTDVQIDWWH